MPGHRGVDSSKLESLGYGMLDFLDPGNPLHIASLRLAELGVCEGQHVSGIPHSVWYYASVLRSCGVLR